MKKLNQGRKAATLTAFLAMGHVALAQSISASGALQSADAIVSGIKDISYHLAAGIIAIVGVVLLVWQGAKYLKGDPNTKDSMLVFAGGLIMIAVLMEVMKTIF